MAVKSNLDRIAAISAQAAVVCQRARQLLADYAKLKELYAGYGGSAWKNAVSDADWKTSGIGSERKNKLDMACSGWLDPLGDLRDDLYLIEE